MSTLTPEDESLKLRQRLSAAEIALAMFMAEKPRIDPRKMAQAYFMVYPTPIASPHGVELCVAASKRGLEKRAKRMQS